MDVSDPACFQKSLGLRMVQNNLLIRLCSTEHEVQYCVGNNSLQIAFSQIFTLDVCRWERVT